jgi:hypothetical protein
MVGCSLAVDPNGIVAQGEFNEFASELITMNINLVNRPQKGTQIGKMLLTKGFSFEYNT